MNLAQRRMYWGWEEQARMRSQGSPAGSRVLRGPLLLLWGWEPLELGDG